MTPKEMKSAIRSLCRELAFRKARTAEWYIGHGERLTHPVAQWQTAMLLVSIRDEWRREKKELGL